MKVMVIVKATADSEAGKLPSQQLLTEMGNYNEELVKAGIMLAGEGLQPSSQGARVRFSGNDRTVTDGPFAETKELIAGFWLWQVKSMDEAIGWVKRCPNPMPGDSEIEIRPLFSAEDFGEAMTPELRNKTSGFARKPTIAANPLANETTGFALGGSVRARRARLHGSHLPSPTKARKAGLGVRGRNLLDERTGNWQNRSGK